MIRRGCGFLYRPKPVSAPIHLMLLGTQWAKRYRHAPERQCRSGFSAVIAVLPTGAAVDAEKPSNLLLQAGQLEAPFADRARALLAQAGGVSR